MNSAGKCCGIHHYCIFIVLAIIISSCVTLPDPEVSQDSNSDVIGVVNSSHSLGQTFEIRRENFNGLTFWTSVDIKTLEDSTQNEQVLIIDLFSETEPRTHIHHTKIWLESTSDIKPVTIFFPPQLNSAGKVFFLSLSTNAGSINVYGRDEDFYPKGQAFSDMHGIDGDIAFTTTYEFDGGNLLDEIKKWFESTWLVVPFLLILFVPGSFLLITSRENPNFEFNQYIGISIGLSLAFIPVLLLWTSTIGIVWNKSTVYFIFGFFTAILVFAYIRKKFIRHELQIARIREWIARQISTGEFVNTQKKYARVLFLPIVLISIFLLSLAIRLIMVRDLATPAWVDSIHHALVTRIILETGALPETYLPYLNIEPTFYHPGFHSQLATFQLLSDLDIHLAMLILGQVLNALMVFAVYSLALSMTKNQSMGIFAAIISGLFTPMPAYYTSWGRYTQLSGLLILVIAYIYFKQAVYKADKRLFSHELVFASVAASGLLIVHYRVTAFLILFIIADIIIRFTFFGRFQVIGRLQVLRLLIIVLLSTLIIIPWLIQAIPNTFLVSLTQPAPSETEWFADFSWSYLNTAWGKQALVLGVLGLLWGIIRRKRFALILLIWVGLLIILANMSALGLPGGGFINTTSIEISLFIPISILAGYIIVEIIQLWKLVFPKNIHQVMLIFVGTLTIILSFIGARNLTSILNPVTFLSRNQDILAIKWVEENIPKEEKILINPFLWGYGLYAGNDGGYWITPLSGRITIPPPVLYGLSPQEDRIFINQISQFAIDHGRDAKELYNIMSENDVAYIYLGARGGPISPKAIASNPGFNKIYDAQGVQIFEVLP